jgi:hypothetical protein
VHLMAVHLMGVSFSRACILNVYILAINCTSFAITHY